MSNQIISTPAQRWNTILRYQISITDKSDGHEEETKHQEERYSRRFLTNKPTETVIISIKRENHSNSELFKKTLLEEFIQFYQSDDNFKSHWWLNAFLPNSLKQVRGKLIFFSRKLFQSDDEEDLESGFQSGQTIQAKFGKQASPIQMLPYRIGMILDRVSQSARSRR
ncbi:hypothetical protein H4Q26_010960 [Puccinia striiformis f. sp. tritici PST-130]|nr:hypothetical protein H4Q26_010960 [Puccinia striiformis f. sp. tritici PST-130]